ncbi:hypothetical protein MRB53_019776 [Persea americana]|uniref:Uncharacterized protein n=1 Tax=Persea americana TaxID=3435 RepID=A0ACC2KZ15_PERAE|nr:hypothetical protein MRB53_019776 [Persea americana]
MLGDYLSKSNRDNGNTMKLLFDCLITAPFFRRRAKENHFEVTSCDLIPFQLIRAQRIHDPHPSRSLRLPRHLSLTLTVSLASASSPSLSHSQTHRLELESSSRGILSLCASIKLTSKGSSSEKRKRSFARAEGDPKNVQKLCVYPLPRRQ